MKTSELIKELAELIAKYGDREIYSLFQSDLYVRLGIYDDNQDSHPLSQAIKVRTEE